MWVSAIYRLTGGALAHNYPLQSKTLIAVTAQVKALSFRFYYPEEFKKFVFFGVSALNDLLLSKSSLLHWLLVIAGARYEVPNQRNNPDRTWSERMRIFGLASIACLSAMLWAEWDYWGLSRSETGIVVVESEYHVLEVLLALGSLFAIPICQGVVLVRAWALFCPEPLNEAATKVFEVVVEKVFAIDWARPSWGYGSRGVYRLA